jgi:hypothetical protein
MDIPREKGIMKSWHAQKAARDLACLVGSVCLSALPQMGVQAA